MKHHGIRNIIESEGMIMTSRCDVRETECDITESECDIMKSQRDHVESGRDITESKSGCYKSPLHSNGES